MIRKSQSEDMASILALWMKSTIYAHPFIEERYWHESEAIVRDVYLPDALRHGIGKALLEYVQQRFPLLSLEVYQKNQSAVNFYHALGFRIEDSAWQEDTAHPTWIMSWQADQTP